jgi:hypothetical protein
VGGDNRGERKEGCDWGGGFWVRLAPPATGTTREQKISQRLDFSNANRGRLPNSLVWFLQNTYSRIHRVKFCVFGCQKNLTLRRMFLKAAKKSQLDSSVCGEISDGERNVGTRLHVWRKARDGATHQEYTRDASRTRESRHHPLSPLTRPFSPALSPPFSLISPPAVELPPVDPKPPRQGRKSGQSKLSSSKSSSTPTRMRSSRVQDLLSEFHQ